MAKLLFITPHTGSPYYDGRISRNLILRARESGKFSKVDTIYTTTDSPARGEFADLSPSYVLKQQVDNLSEFIVSNRYTQVEVVGALGELKTVTDLLDLPADILTVGRLYPETTLIPAQYGGLALNYDLFYLPNGMAKAAYQGAMSQFKPAKEDAKAHARAYHHLLVEPVMIDTGLFYPPSQKAKDPDIAEIRQYMFNGEVKSSDYLIMISGQPTCSKGIPQALHIIKALKRLDASTTYRLYMHMPKVTDVDIPLLVEGNELEMGKDVIWGYKAFEGGFKIKDEDMRHVYNGMNLVMSTDLQDSWNHTVCEANACGVKVAVPEESTTAMALDGLGAIELPTDQFEWTPGCLDMYVRRVNPELAAKKILENK